MGLQFKYPPELFVIVDKEISANQIERPLWLKAHAESGGDEARTRATYMRHRVGQLEAIAWIAAEPERKAQRKAKVDKVIATLLVLWGIGTVIALIFKNL